MKGNFNDFRFEGLESRRISNNYLTMNRVSKDENKIVVRVAKEHLVKTPYGYALILDKTRVVFLKDWQVSKNYYGNEVLLNKNYFNIKTWGNHDDFLDSDENLSFDSWLNTAKEQESIEVKWETNFKKEFNKMMYGF